jgi:pseudouridine-5'-phosphate glycosidase
MMKLSSTFALSPKVSYALNRKDPVVALESTVITHGLPHPENLILAKDMESEIQKHGATPATIAVMDGYIRIGLSADQIEKLGTASDVRKISIRDFGPALVDRALGGTTVAGSIFAGFKAGIRVFATGGIGGVHRNKRFDISADLPQLAKTPMIVVCAGAKAILDLEATIEQFETMGIPTLGYGTEEFPAFYSRESGFKTITRADSPEEVVRIATAHWETGLTSAILVVVPPPDEIALPIHFVEEAIHKALSDAKEQNIHGPGVTPYLLQRVSELTGKTSLQTNLGLLLNNAVIAAEIAVEISKQNHTRMLL